MKARRELPAADVLAQMPWYWCVAHWIVTVMVLIPLVLALVLCIGLSWIKYDWASRMSDRACELAHDTRWWIMQRVYKKYGLFLMLKQTG